MELLREIVDMGHERLIVGHEAETGYRGIIAIHDTTRGPAVGGIRFMSYDCDGDAIRDALRLSRAMTLKNALADLAWGGGKSVIIRYPGEPDRIQLLRAHGRLIETLGGLYIGAEDVGTSPEDIEHVRRETAHVAGVKDGTGDPAPATARGVRQAMRAAAAHLWGDPGLEGRRVAIQGCGNVGRHLAALLRDAGATIVITDIDPDRLRTVREETAAETVEPERIYDVSCDIFAPCALGAVLDDGTIPRLRAEMVVGAANNQLAEDRHDLELRKRGILYVPDFVANAGGVIDGHRLVAGWSEAEATDRVSRIYDTTHSVLLLAEREDIGTHAAAERLASERLAGGRPCVGRGRTCRPAMRGRGP